MREVYEVIVIHEDETEEWVPCHDAVELQSGRLAAEIIPGNTIFRQPGRWRKVQKPLFGGQPAVDHIRQEIKDLIRRGNVTSYELKELRCNSWEWEALVPAMTDEAFVERTEYTLKNCSQPRRQPNSTYDEALQWLWVPELLKRFQRAASGWKTFEEVVDNVREALGQESTHYLVIADDVGELVEAITVDRAASDRDSEAWQALNKIRREPGSGNGNPKSGKKQCHVCGAHQQPIDGCRGTGKPCTFRPHIVNDEFQSDKYPTCPRGKVPLSTKDPMAQDLLWLYAKRRRLVDAEFADDLEFALRAKGYDGTVQGPSRFGLGIFIEEPQAVPRDKDGTFLCFSCRKSPAVGMSCGGPICASCAHDLPFTSFPLNGLLCPVCKLPQRNTSGGASCENGHGGEVGAES